MLRPERFLFFFFLNSNRNHFRADGIPLQRARNNCRVLCMSRRLDLRERDSSEVRSSRCVFVRKAVSFFQSLEDIRAACDGGRTRSHVVAVHSNSCVLATFEAEQHVRVVSSSSCGFQAASAFDVQLHLLEEQCAAWRVLGADAFLAWLMFGFLRQTKAG